MSGRFTNLEFGDEKRGREAEGKLAEILATGPTAADYIARARAEDRGGQFESALRLYTRALHEDRSAIIAWVGQVQMLVQLDECHEARLWSDKALELFRNNGELLAAKAQACLRLRDIKAGLACSDASLQSPGSSPWRWQVRGETLLASGKRHFDECFQKAIAEPSADWFDRVIIARIYLFHRRATSAMAYLRQAVECEPTNGYVWFAMGNCQKALGLMLPARESYLRCIEIRPDYLPATRAVEAMASPRSILTWFGDVLRRWSRR